MLTGANANANERLLYEQRDEWNETRLDLRSGGTFRDQYLAGTTSYDWTGRGGSAVWRAERRVEMQDFEEWLIKHPVADTVERRVQPPGWLARVPSTWHAHWLPTAAKRMPAPYATWAAAGRVLAFPVGRRTAIWPLIRGIANSEWGPVPGMEPVIEAASTVRPDQVSGFIEAVLVDWSEETPDEAPCPLDLHLPADAAYDFGFIDADERRQAMVQAREATLQRMTDIINGLPEGEGHQRAALEQARGDTRLFGRIVDQLGIKVSVSKATWVWPGRSVVEEINTGTRAEIMQWLATWAHKTCTSLLQHSMDQAWHEAFDRYHAEASQRHYAAGRRFLHPDVTPTITESPSLSFEMDADPFRFKGESKHDQDRSQHE